MLTLPTIVQPSRKKNNLELPDQQSTSKKKRKVDLPNIAPKLSLNRLHINQYIPISSTTNTPEHKKDTYDSSDSKDDDIIDKFDDSINLKATTFISRNPLNDHVNEVSTG